MIIKIIKKIQQNGFRKTVQLIYERIMQNILVKFNFVDNKTNYIRNECSNYWKAYNYLKRRYKKKILKMDKKNGTGEFSNKVWWCWLQGEENCPPLQKACLKSLRENLTDREIIVINKDNLYKYIDLPDYIKKKYEENIISNTHFSDLVRLQLLIKYGGTWIDSTAYCTGYPPELFDKPLFVFKNLNSIWYANKNKFDMEPIVADNWFITSEIENPILIMVRDLLFDYWKKHDYLLDYFIFHYFFSIVVKYKYNEEFDKIGLKSHLIPHLLQYECYKKYNEERAREIFKQSDFHKLTHKIDFENIDEDSYYNMIIGDKINNDRRR